MKDKYLGRDGITKRHNFRGQCIEGAQILGMAVGFGYSLVHMAPDFFVEQNLNVGDFKKVIGGFAIGISSYMTGNYLHKRNERKREKALKNIELALEREEIK